MLASFVIALAAAAQAPAVEAPANDASTIDVVASQAEQPAVMMNRGIDLALQGRDLEARALFEAVKAMNVDYTLETRDGRWIYPPDLARSALKRLDRGEFRTGALALRD